MNSKLLFKSLTLLCALYATSASAYIFGPPNVTEIAENGENSNSVGLFTRSEDFVSNLSSTPATYTSTGLAGVAKHGDNTGAFDFMYRLSQTKLSSSSNYSSIDLGFGLGGEWNMLSDRSLSILANLQFDEGGASDTGYDSFKVTLGGEVGAAYRIFVGTATIAPFAMYNVFSNAESVTPTTGNDYSLYRNGSSTNFGVSLIYGRLNLSYTATSSSYKRTFSNSSSSANFTSNGSMIYLGINF